MITGHSEAKFPIREFPFTDADFKALSSLATDVTGIYLPAGKRDMVYARLARRLRTLHLSDFAAYRIFLQQSGNSVEITELVNALSTPVTHFWREPHHFKHLQDVVVPQAAVRAAQDGDRIRLWSAGCAAGQEAYTLAMALEQAGQPGRILATDINTNVLKTAEQGLYETRDIARLPVNWSKKFWQAEEQHWRASPCLRERLSFRHLNLQLEWPMRRRFDAIFCRNVMIYFNAQGKQRLLNRFATLLQPGGWLYIGHAENILPFDSRFKLVERTIYQLQDEVMFKPNP